MLNVRPSYSIPGMCCCIQEPVPIPLRWPYSHITVCTPSDSHSLHPPLSLFLLYRRVAPSSENPTTTNPTIIGVLSMGWSAEPAFFFVPLAALVAVAVTLPDPAVAVPAESPPATLPPAFWLPAPVSPAPFPAPAFIRFAAATGIAGSASLVTFQFALCRGHPEAPPVAL
jgi:hypothetical protein